MDVLDFINRNGQRTIPNPNYNPRSKKNTQPPTLIVPDTQVFPDEAVELARRDALNQFSIDSNIADKYREYGINYNPRENLDKVLADAQSNWSKGINALGQTLISEIVLGTARGISDLVDAVGQAVGLSDHDYSNPVSQFFEEKQKEFEEWAPIYADPENNTLKDQFTGGFNLGYWFSNMPSIASSLTLLLPSTYVTKALSWVGKASKISKYTNRAARAIVNPVAHAVGRSGFTSAEMGVAFETGINAALSRTMENYQEARQTYNDSYLDISKSLDDMSDTQYAAFLQRNAQYLKDNNINTDDKDEVAKQLARSAADRTFQLDFANVIFDAYQIYGLRNLLTHAPRFNQSAATRAAQRNAIRTAGMTEEQAAAELAKDTTLKKVKNWFGDKFIGFGRQIKSELSEGVEEAVNYIAQQEGTHLGKYLLTGEDGDSRDLNFISNIGPMTSRLLNDYYNDTGLWDSAFWGVVGGVVFQAGGSKLNRISQTIKNRQEEKKSSNKDNDKTKEAKVTPHWWALDQSSETKRMLTEINGRNQKLQNLRSAMNRINQGFNPYIKKEDGTDQEISSPVEERMLREKAYTEYLDELIITARNNGTLRMLNAYLQDSNVQNAIVSAYQGDNNNNKVSKEEAQQAAAKASERIKKIDRMYQDEIIHASNIADDVGDEEGTSLPAEYIQMIASSNVRHKLNIERYDEVAALYNEDTERIKRTLKDKLDSTIDYRGLISLRTTIQELSSLIAQKKKLMTEQKDNPTITRQFDIEELDNQIDLIKRKALDTSTDAQFARALYALNVVNSAEFDEHGKITVSDIDLVENIDKLLTEDLSYVFYNLGHKERTDLSPEAVVGELKKVMNDMRYVLPVDAEGNRKDADSYLRKLDPTLPDNYDILARIELEKIKETARLAETEDEIRHYIGAINNVENIARKRAIEDAYTTISDIQRNHLDLDIMDIADRIYDENSASWLIDTNDLSEEERNKLKDSLEILNLADIKNRNLYENLGLTLAYARAAQAQVNANNKQNTEPQQGGTQNPSASQNANGAQQAGGMNNQSNGNANQAGTQGNGQNGQVGGQNVPQQITLSYNGNTITANAPKAGETNVKVIVPVKDLGNGHYELDFVSKGKDVNPDDISNNRLFDVQQQPMDGAVVKRNPIVTFGANGEVQVVAQGLVQNPTLSSTGEPSGSAPNAQSYIDRMNNSNNESEVEAIYREGLAAGVPESDLRTAFDTKVQQIRDAAKNPVGPENPVGAADPADYIPQIAAAARDAAMKLKNGETVTYEEYLGSLAAVKTAINDDATFERIAKERWNAAMQRLAKKYPDVVDNVLNILQSSTTEEAPTSNLGYRFKTSFKKEVEKLVKAYLKDIGQKKVNGKYIISLENLLRYCNGEFQNNENAELLYNVLANYLTSDEASETYQVIESKGEIASNDFLDKVKTPLEERIDRSIREENHRINTIEIKDKEVFDELEPGQELTTTEDKDRIYFNFNGKPVGFIGKPKVVNGSYSSPYKFFLFTIRPNGKNTYYSKLADVFKSIVNATSGELEEIKNAALVGGISLKDNKTWQAIKAEYGINTVDPETGEEYDNVDDTMLQVIRTMANFAVKYGSAEKAIDGWFNALAQEYIAADYLSKNKNAKVTVDAITDGFLIRNTEKLTDEHGVIIPSEVDKLPLASKAIGKNYKGRVSIAIGSRREAGTIETVVKKENGKVTIPASNSLPGVGYANTFVVFPLSNGKTAYAQAFPVTAKHLTPGSQAAAIATAFRKRIDYYLEQIANNPSDERLFMELQDFLFEALNYKNSTVPLFHMGNCEKVNKNNFDPNQRGTHIGTNGRNGRPRRDLHIFYNKNGNPTVSIDRTDATKRKDIPLDKANLKAISDEIRSFLADTLQFNISSEYIASDNNTRHQIEGLATRDADGKFVVRIGDETFTFDSYNDFILENDLVRVNTKPNEHGNNVSRSSSNPNVRYKIVTSSPVEGTMPGPKPVSDIKARANQIMASDATNKASQLASLIFDDDTVKLLDKYDLLPHNLVFDSQFNVGEGRGHLNASFNRNTKVTTIGTKFLAMLNSPNEAYRKQAIRKLIHERLHDILHSDGNEHYVKDIKTIYDTFVSYLDDEEFAKPILEKYLKKIKSNKSVDEYYDNFKKYKYFSKENEEVRLEEFLVDTLTSVELAEFLNNITGLSKVNMRERKRDTLLNRIMRVLAKLMGINIKNDSLYAQEFETLRNIMNTTAESNEEFNEQVAPKEENEEATEEVTEEPTEEEIPDEQTDSQYDFDEEDDDEFASSTSEEVAEYNQELEDIKSKAIADGTFMKAPNGNPTNLNERQWLQVRTKAFKEWFGDWINASIANMVSLGKEIPNTDKYSKYGQKGETDIEIREVLDEKGNVIGTVRMEFSGKNRKGVVTLHPQLSVTGKGYGTALYQYIADTYGIPVEESFGEIGKSEAGKALWNKLQRDNNTQISKGDIPLRQLLPTNASKVVDENGEPLVVYHFTRDASFTTYRKNPNGLHFTKDPQGKDIFAPNINPYSEKHAVFLNIKNPAFEINGEYITDKIYSRERELERKAKELQPKTSDKKILEEWRDLWDKISDLRVFHISRTLGKEGEALQKLKEKDANVDGVLREGAYQYSWENFIVFNSNQVKSATDNNGIFSTENDDIRYSSTSEEYENVASIADYILSYSPEDRAEIAKEINSGEISIKCK